MKTTEIYEVVKFKNEEGFKDGWYVIEANTDGHVVYQSEVFETEKNANEFLLSLE